MRRVAVGKQIYEHGRQSTPLALDAIYRAKSKRAEAGAAYHVRKRLSVESLDIESVEGVLRIAAVAARVKGASTWRSATGNSQTSLLLFTVDDLLFTNQ